MTRTERFTFPGSGGDQLAARLDLPYGEPIAYALFAHCFTCSKDVLAASRISRGLVEKGLGVLRFDFTGLGSSDGDFANTDFSSNVEDLVAAAQALSRSHAGPRLLVGHSLGGAAVLAAATSIPSVTAVATVAAPFDPGHIEKLFPPETLATLRREGRAEVTLAGRAFTVGAGLIEDASSQNLQACLEELGSALLVLHSPTDDQVDVDNARQIYEAARHPKSFVTLDGADHLLTRPEDAQYVADILATWFSRYLPEPEPEDGDQQHKPGGTVYLEESGVSTLSQSIQAGRHHWTSDEPGGGGNDTGPTPYDLLLSSLGACTAMTLRMYADRAELPLQGVSVQLSHRRSHLDDCADPDGEPCTLEHIDRTLRLTGPLDDAQRARLVEIADRCPVHRTLTGEIQITTRVEETASAE